MHVIEISDVPHRSTLLLSADSSPNLTDNNRASHKFKSCLIREGRREHTFSAPILLPGERWSHRRGIVRRSGSRGQCGRSRRSCCKFALPCKVQGGTHHPCLFLCPNEMMKKKRSNEVRHQGLQCRLIKHT